MEGDRGRACKAIYKRGGLRHSRARGWVGCGRKGPPCHTAASFCLKPFCLSWCLCWALEGFETPARMGALLANRRGGGPRSWRRGHRLALELWGIPIHRLLHLRWCWSLPCVTPPALQPSLLLLTPSHTNSHPLTPRRVLLPARPPLLWPAHVWLPARPWSPSPRRMPSYATAARPYCRAKGFLQPWNPSKFTPYTAVP